MFIAPSESWFALQVVPQHEKKVALMLEYTGYEKFLPTFLSRRKWSDRVKTIEQPLFPGYVFCRVKEESLGPLGAIPGVSRIVGFGGKPAYIPDGEISAVARAAKSGLDVCPFSPFAKVGQQVRVRSGPLSGVVGRLLRINNRSRLILAVEVALKAIAIDIDASDVAPLEFTQ
jgi:transcription antitermination factor NusG